MSEDTSVISHWHHYAEEFNTSATEFYASVRKELEELKVPVSFSNVEWSEGGIMSAKRAYLRVTHNRLNFDICAAPFGRNFFFSWWLGRQPGNLMAGCLTILALPVLWGIMMVKFGLIVGTILALILAGVGLVALSSAVRSGASEAADMLAGIPYIGPVLDRFLRPVTYYSIDSRMMFEETVHQTVLKIVDGLLTAKGAKALSVDERKHTSGGKVR